MTQRRVAVTRTIAAAPETIFDMLADPAQHPLIDGSGTVRASRGGSRRLTLRSTFGMDMKIMLPYAIRSTVVEFEDNRLIAWQHPLGHRWRWQLTPTDDGQTEVTEMFDWSGGLIPPLFFGLTSIPRLNKGAITKTLDGLANRFAAR
jgi:uncharacterized protein YndB with AHSA1/START domain